MLFISCSNKKSALLWMSNQRKQNKTRFIFFAFCFCRYSFDRSGRQTFVVTQSAQSRR